MRHREAARGAPDLQIHADHWAGWGGGHGREEGERQVIRANKRASPHVFLITETSGNVSHLRWLLGL